jgi:hypothetical protein
MEVDTEYAAQLERSPMMQQQASAQDATVVAQYDQSQKPH